MSKPIVLEISSDLIIFLFSHIGLLDEVAHRLTYKNFYLLFLIYIYLSSFSMRNPNLILTQGIRLTYLLENSI